MSDSSRFPLALLCLATAIGCGGESTGGAPRVVSVDFGVIDSGSSASRTVSIRGVAPSDILDVETSCHCMHVRPAESSSADTLEVAVLLRPTSTSSELHESTLLQLAPGARDDAVRIEAHAVVKSVPYSEPSILFADLPAGQDEFEVTAVLTFKGYDQPIVVPGSPTGDPRVAIGPATLVEAHTYACRVDVSGRLPEGVAERHHQVDLIDVVSGAQLRLPIDVRRISTRPPDVTPRLLILARNAEGVASGHVVVGSSTDWTCDVSPEGLAVARRDGESVRVTSRCSGYGHLTIRDAESREAVARVSLCVE